MKVLTQTLMESDVIIYDVATSLQQEVEFVIKTLRMGDYKENKIFELISSVLVWSNTPPKEKASPPLSIESGVILLSLG